MKPLAHLGNQSRTHALGIHGLRKDLHGNNVVIAVHDQPGQEIGFAENHAVGIRIANHGLAIGDGIGEARAKQRRKIANRLLRDHSNSDLRRTGIERTAEALAAVIHYADQRAGGNAIGRNDVGPIDPDVTVFQAGSAARRNFDGRGGGAACLLRHAAILATASWRRVEERQGRAFLTWPKRETSSRTAQLRGLREGSPARSWAFRCPSFPFHVRTSFRSGVWRR